MTGRSATTTPWLTSSAMSRGFVTKPRATRMSLLGLLLPNGAAGRYLAAALALSGLKGTKGRGDELGIER